MRALTLTQPWAGIVASGIKLVENRSRRLIKPCDFGKPFAVHAGKVIDDPVYDRIREIAPELFSGEDHGPWYRLSRITGSVIAVAAIDKVFDGWDEETIAEHASCLSFSSGELLGPDQVRWFFGPVGYVLRDVRALAKPVPCRGALGFWTLPTDVELSVAAQVRI